MSSYSRTPLKMVSGSTECASLPHDQVDAHCVLDLQRQDDAKYGQGARRRVGLRHRLVLQALGLVAPGVHAGHAVVGLGQHRLDLLILVACQDGAEEVVAIHGSGSPTGQVLLREALELCEDVVDGGVEVLDLAVDAVQLSRIPPCVMTVALRLLTQLHRPDTCLFSPGELGGQKHTREEYGVENGPRKKRESDTPSILLHTPSSLDSLFSSPSPDRRQSPISTTSVLSNRRTSLSIPSKRSRLSSMCSFTSSWILSSSEMILSFVFPAGVSLMELKVRRTSESSPCSLFRLQPHSSILRPIWEVAFSRRSILLSLPVTWSFTSPTSSSTSEIRKLWSSKRSRNTVLRSFTTFSTWEQLSSVWWTEPLMRLSRSRSRPSSLSSVGADLRARALLRRHSALEGLDVDLEAVQAVLGVVLQPPQLVLHPAARLTAAVSERLDLCDDAVEVFPAVAGQGFDLTHVVAQPHSSILRPIWEVAFSRRSILLSLPVTWSFTSPTSSSTSEMRKLWSSKRSRNTVLRSFTTFSTWEQLSSVWWTEPLMRLSRSRSRPSSLSSGVDPLAVRLLLPPQILNTCLQEPAWDMSRLKDSTTLLYYKEQDRDTLLSSSRRISFFRESNFPASTPPPDSPPSKSLPLPFTSWSSLVWMLWIISFISGWAASAGFLPPPPPELPPPPPSRPGFLPVSSWKLPFMPRRVACTLWRSLVRLWIFSSNCLILSLSPRPDHIETDQISPTLSGASSTLAIAVTSTALSRPGSGPSGGYLGPRATNRTNAAVFSTVILYLGLMNVRILTPLHGNTVHFPRNTAGWKVEDKDRFVSVSSAALPNHGPSRGNWAYGGGHFGSETKAVQR
ncbi:hypothetical protein CRUP_008004 [Coryphaenoides rupestris]|nr:hypothetical protein CRUP_008004 [Coryphaenoides rupestris]